MNRSLRANAPTPSASAFSRPESLRRATAIGLCVLFAFALLCSARPTSADEPPPAFLLKWGQQGSGPGDFNGPYDVACAPDGTVLVSDFGNSRIQRFTGEGEFLQQWPVARVGIDPGYPAVLAVDGQGSVYVCVQSGYIQKFTPAGAFVTQWRLQQTTSGIVPQAFGIAVGSDGNIFVAESRKQNIQKFTPDGVYLLRWGTEGTGPGQFQSLLGLAADQAGHIYALAYYRVEVFDLIGNYQFEWGSLGSGPGQFGVLDDATVDPLGNIYVSDESQDRIQKFAPDGSFLTMWGSYGVGDGQFQNPVGLSSDLQGNVYVADPSNRRVQKFGSAPVPVATVTWGRLKARYR